MPYRTSDVVFFWFRISHRYVERIYKIYRILPRVFRRDHVAHN